MRTLIVLSAIPDEHVTRVHLALHDLDQPIAHAPLVDVWEVLPVPAPFDAHEVGIYLPEVLRTMAARYERVVYADSLGRTSQPSFTPAAGRDGRT